MLKLLKAVVYVLPLCANNVVHRLYYFFSGKLLVATGYPSANDGSFTAEVIDLEDPTMECNNLERYPVNFFSGVAGLMAGNVPVICGGRKDVSSIVSDKCYTLGNSTPLATMSTPRYEAAGVVLDDGQTLWITGGHKAHAKGLKSTEYFKLNEDIQSGPDLPAPLYGHCVVDFTINGSNVVMFIGGIDSGYFFTQRTRFFNTSSMDNWTIPGPKARLSVMRDNLGLG